MKKLTIAVLAVILMIYLGYIGMNNHSSSGPFFLFVGSCTAIGVTLDIVIAVRERIRKANLRKLRP